ncbi:MULTISPECIES: long-chain fatty acid--CoA ligase [Archaeoglobus]|jgi:fatty-acyl-CoA synthase|uniref:Long-chain-fatty-acid--CoA ligase (FadD-6) n=3 Tax=Archaeoglobus fulgidus TaxID=2234 RepID=O28762_ARCFU|nr:MULTISPECIES: long-chain fatty acid--CoA ligase [Archaeoglobus]AAB89737.1 long-chain-fatty-acid--CoA ligase (fadD-6) [Archaeoglobus fulgidus DSM 4304]AIG98520.1 Acyl-CoA synthetase (AMP-forming)/AMP-acid ligase II [Archaeoglobus fulgidus DSM 8774]KUJ94223.1 MAG: Long-chain-fatty-acid--CoA ligase (FadD-6) [Archaeoglobus fulgidus]KUK06788.1 MAG: Long-chain-fatty-acid--CoA ligase (FadD-6) [Archaeoglobus fulgidus]MDI3496770.1 fatty-acyl-CoA synthase [Archaeoglobus sp.]
MKPWFRHWPPLLTKTLDYPRVPLFEFVETSARRFGDKAAIIYYGREITYNELLDAVERFATFLSNAGVEKGDRVAIYAQNSPQFVIAFFGIMRANAAVVPVNPMLVERELEYVLSDSGSKLVVATSELAGRVLPVAKKLGIQVVCGNLSDFIPEQPTLPVPDFAKLKIDVEGTTSWSEAMKERNPPEVMVGSDDLALIPYTAGTTGLPKGCMHTHFTAIANVLSSVHWFNLTPSAISLATLPFFHVTGMVHSMLAPVYIGATMVLLTRWDRETALQAIERYRCTHWVNITTMVIDLLSDPKIAERDLSSLLVVGGGGAPMPKAVAEKLYQLTGIRYMEGYGLTETISQTHMNPPQNPKLQCLGIPDFGVDALVIDIETGKPLPPNEEGEIVVSGPEIFKGYWNKPEETEKAFIEIDGKRYFRTGDLGYMDEDGYFFIVDRIKRMINRSGFKVWPAEVEAVLYKHPAVKEVCVIGVPDERVVEEVKAFIVVNPEYRGKITEEEIIQWAKQQMAAYKYPRIVEFDDELPKSGAGKILWRLLQEREKEKLEKGGG